MLIYIEGVDRAGKSFFARQLSEIAEIPIYRKADPKLLSGDEFHAYFKGVAFALMELHNIYRFSVIVDRSFVSDWVYTNVHKCVKPFDVWRDWERGHKYAKDVMLVYVDTPNLAIHERIQRESDPYMTEEDILPFKGMYEDYLGRTSFPVIRIDGSADLDLRRRELAAVLELVHSS